MKLSYADLDSIIRKRMRRIKWNVIVINLPYNSDRLQNSEGDAFVVSCLYLARHNSKLGRQMDRQIRPKFTFSGIRTF